MEKLSKKAIADFYNQFGISKEYTIHPIYLYAKECFPKGNIYSLDVGCGVGDALIFFADLTTLGIGLDLSRKRVEVAKHKAEKLKRAGKLDFIVGDANHLPFRENSFNAVTCFETLEHLEDPATVLCEVRRVLLRQGFFAVSVPNSLYYYRPMIREKSRQIIDGSFSFVNLRKLLKDHGFCLHKSYSIYSDKLIPLLPDKIFIKMRPLLKRLREKLDRHLPYFGIYLVCITLKKYVL